ncbi:MAG: hypothetical protein ACQGVK_14005 [Myxococcota bacterium]
MRARATTRVGTAAALAAVATLACGVYGKPVRSRPDPDAAGAAPASQTRTPEGEDQENGETNP